MYDGIKTFEAVILTVSYFYHVYNPRIASIHITSMY